MRRIHLANSILLCLLGTLAFWPNVKPSNVYGSLEDSYSSVCLVECADGSGTGSGVLLESGFILTAAHVIDNNQNGILEDDEKKVILYFPNIQFITAAEAVMVSTEKDEVDIAVLDPSITVPLRGSRLMTIDDYRDLPVGTPSVTIGMPMGMMPANITDGRLISKDPSSRIHRNSANSYMGNSGGGVFVNNQLAGILVRLSYDRGMIRMPIYEERKQVGEVMVPYIIPMSNNSFHTSAPAIADYLDRAGMIEILKPNMSIYPYQEYIAVVIFNLILIVWLILIFKLMSHWVG